MVASPKLPATSRDASTLLPTRFQPGDKLRPTKVVVVVDVVVVVAGAVVVVVVVVVVTVVVVVGVVTLSVNVAFTLIAPVMVRLQPPVPMQVPLQPEKVLPEAGEAVSVTLLPLGYIAVQVLPLLHGLMPYGLPATWLPVMTPEPVPAEETLRITKTSVVVVVLDTVVVVVVGA